MVMSLPAGTYVPTEGARPRKWGVRGPTPMGTAAGIVPMKETPGDLWFFPSLERTLSASPPNRAEPCLNANHQ